MFTMKIALVLFFMEFLFLCKKNVFVMANLAPGGANVCSRSVSYTAYTKTQKSRTGYDSYRTCCKRFWGACTSRCTRYRTKTVHYYVSVPSTRYKQDYYCCQGWAKQGNQCPLAICNPGCKNGHCTKPNVCSCNSGWNGNLCQNDINECLRAGVCSHDCTNVAGSYSCSCRVGYKKPTDDPRNSQCVDVNECLSNPCSCSSGNIGCSTTCVNSVGSFMCTCKVGFELQHDKTTCSDKNECLLANGRCQQTCLNNIGSFTCACKTGYLLNPINKRTCDDVDECKSLNGGCSQICLNSIGSYRCDCKRGYRKQQDGRTCKDIDECSLSKPCDNSNGICKNIMGSYKCLCKIGYKLMPDGKTCVDINECAREGDNKCEHVCANNVGSYTCSCNKGYRLQSTPAGTLSSKCNDIDECKENIDNCDHFCQNTIGSFKCSCRPGYILEPDISTCRALPCETLPPPLHGYMNCTGYVTDEACTFSCEEGFDLTGNISRTCLPTTLWSGEIAECGEKQCPKFEPPFHASTLMPCVEFYGSSCATKCKHGYYMKGSIINQCSVADGVTYWTPNNASCYENRPCSPNPCLHNGKCTEQLASFTCNCKNTGYSGSNCQTGVVKVPPYPDLLKDTKSARITISAIPDQNLRILLKASDTTALSITHKTLYFYKNENDVSFTITPRAVGKFTIYYVIDGANSDVFIPPKPSTFYVSEKPPVIGPVNITHDLFEKTCSFAQVSPGCSKKEQLILKSSCDWSNDQTSGFVAIGNNNVSFPLSLLGISGKGFNELVDLRDEMKAFLKTRVVSKECSVCPGIEYNTATVNYANEYSYFQRSFFQSFAELLPFWLKIELTDGQLSAIENFVSFFGTGSQITAIPECSELNMENANAFVAYLPNLPIKFLFLNTAFQSEISNAKYCFAVDLCTQKTYISLPVNQNIDLSSAFKDIGLANIKVSFHDLAFTNDDTCFVYKSLPMKAGVCVNSDMRMSVKGELTFRHTQMKFDGVVGLDFKSLEETLLVKFDSQTLLAFNGEIQYTINMAWLGNTLKIFGRESKAEMFVDVGGPNLKACPLCASKGFYVSVQLDENSFEYSSSIVKFQPKDSGKLYIAYDLVGGTITGVKLSQSLKLNAKHFINILTRLEEKVTEFLSNDFPEDVKIIKYLIQRVITVLDSIENYASNEFSYLYVTTFKVKQKLYELQSAAKSLMKRVKSTATEAVLKLILLRVQALRGLEALSDSQPVKAIDQGVVVSYVGDICILNLCFKSMAVNINDVHSCPQCEVDDAVVMISGESKMQAVYAERVALSNGQEFKLLINRNMNDFHGSFKANVKILDNWKEASFEFDSKTIKYTLTDLDTGDGIKFKITGKSDIATVTWESLVYSVHGTILDTSPFAQKWQSFYQKKALFTLRRTEKLKERLTEADIEHKINVIDVETKRKEYFEIEQNHTVASGNYLKTRNDLITLQAEMKSYLDNSPNLLKLITKDMDSICKLETCAQRCLSALQCEICHEKIYKDTKTLKCEQFKQRIDYNRLTTFESICNVEKRRFHTVYTGTCPLSAAEQAQQNIVLKSIAKGSAIGSMIAGPIGSVVGGVIGAVVGFFGGLFSSCDKHYEVITEIYNDQQPCTLTKMKVETVLRPVSKCYYVTTSLFTGYNQGEECNCQQNPCATKITPAACIQSNNQCKVKRSLFVAASVNVPPEFTKLRADIEALENKVSEDFLLLDDLKQSRNFKKYNYEKAQNLFANSKRNVDRTREVFQNMRVLLKTDVCISDAYKTAQNLSDTLTIEEITFDTNLPIINNIQLDLFIVDKSKSNKVVLPVVYDFEQKETSLEVAARKVLNNLLCSGHKRKRRDVNEIEVEESDLPFSWKVDPNATLIQSSCLAFTEVMEFLNFVVTSASKITEHALKTHKTLAQSRSIPTEDSDEPVVRAQNRLILNSNKIREAQMLKYTVANVLKDIKEQLEFLVTAQNISSCFSFVDCKNAVFDTMESLPVVSNFSRNGYKSLVILVNESISNIFQKSHSNLAELNEQVLTLKATLTTLNVSSLYCTEGPSILPNLPRKVDLMVDDVFRLKCDVVSKLPSQIYWYFNEKIIDGESGQQLSFRATVQKAGVYKCLVISQTGNSTSNGTTLNVYSTPSVRPLKNVTFYRPNPLRNISLVCNATGAPVPQLQWYYRSFKSQVFHVLPNENLTLLILRVDDRSVSGYYSCSASNTFGSVNSTVARVDVLETKLAAQQLFVSVELTKTNPLQDIGHFQKLEQKLKLSEDQFVRVTYETPTVNFTLLSTPKSPNTTSDSFFDAAAISRQDLANSGATFLNEVAVNNTIVDDNGLILDIDNTTFMYNSTLNICPSGYIALENGYLCGQCPVGTYGFRCGLCPLNTYQSHPGQEMCIKCDQGKITDHIGATAAADCKAIVYDIVFVIDTHRLRLFYKAFLRRLIMGIYGRFSKSSVRFGVVGYDSNATVYLSLNEPINRMEGITQKLNTEFFFRMDQSSVHVGLKAAHRMFDKFSRHSTMKIAIAVLPQSSLFDVQFTEVRKAALKLQNSGVHMLSTVYMPRFNLFNMDLVVASHPKLKNAFSVDGIRESTKAVQNLLNNTPLSTSRSVDIALLFEPRKFESIGSYVEVNNQLQELFANVRNISSAKINFRFLEADKILKKGIFRKQTTREFKRNVNRLTKYYDGLKGFDLRAKIEEVVNTGLTEYYYSLSKTKVVLVVTEKPINVSETLSIERWYDEQVIVANFAFDFGGNSQPTQAESKYLKVWLLELYQTELFERLLLSAVH